MVDLSAAHVDCDPRNPAFYCNPASTYARWHNENPVFFWKQYGIWCFSRFDDVNNLLRDSRFGRKLDAFTAPNQFNDAGESARLQHFNEVEAHSLLNLEPPVHTAMRALVNKAFISRQVETLRPFVMALAHQTVDSFASERRVELIDQYAMPIPATVIAQMVGVPRSRVPDLLRWSHAMVKVYTRQQSVQEEVEANLAAQEFDAFLRASMAEKRAVSSDDLLSHLMRVQIDGRSLSESEIVSTVVLLLNAGHEASVHLTGNAVYAILQRGMPPSELFADQTHSSASAQEILRFCSPLHMFMRYALEDVELDNGLVIRRGEEVGLLLGAANRDPARFNDPDSFDPGRNDGGHVSLGAGIHFCLGAVLAKMELEVTLETLFERIPDVQLAEIPTVRDSFHFHGLERLLLQW